MMKDDTFDCLSAVAAPPVALAPVPAVVPAVAVAAVAGGREGVVTSWMDRSFILLLSLAGTAFFCVHSMMCPNRE